MNRLARCLLIAAAALVLCGSIAVIAYGIFGLYTHSGDWRLTLIGAVAALTSAVMFLAASMLPA